jgi:hypothetical protein
MHDIASCGSGMERSLSPSTNEHARSPDSAGLRFGCTSGGVPDQTLPSRPQRQSDLAPWRRLSFQAAHRECRLLPASAGVARSTVLRLISAGPEPTQRRSRVRTGCLSRREHASLLLTQTRDDLAAQLRAVLHRVASRRVRGARRLTTLYVDETRSGAGSTIFGATDQAEPGRAA